MAEKKTSLGSQLATQRWAAATPQEKRAAARNRVQARCARWRADNSQPPKRGDEKFVTITAPRPKRKGKS